MKRRHFASVITGLMVLACIGFGGVAHARGTVPQGTTYDAPTSIGGSGWVNTSHLWLPDDVNIIRGAIVQYSSRFDPSWQALARAHGFALIIIDNYYVDTICSKDGQNFLNDLAWYANASGHPEITNLPFIFTGWSKGGQVAEAFNEWIPGRTISFIANKGGFYRSRPSYAHEAAALKTPAIVVAGEKDADFRNTAITSLFEINRPSGARWALAFEGNSPHQEGAVNGMWFTFFDHAIRARYPARATPLNGPVKLLDMPENSGWLATKPTIANGLSGKVYPYAKYTGNRTTACWLMDADVANLYRGFATYNPAVTVTVVGGPVFAAGQTIQFNVAVDSALFPGWVSADVYDGAVKLGTVTNGGSTTVSAVRPWGGRGVTAIARDAAGNERTSIPQPFVVSNAVALTNHPATPVLQTSADLKATFSPAWGSYTITAHWGTVDGGSNAANWKHSAAVGTCRGGDPMNLSYKATGLSPATTYYYTFSATKSGKQVWPDHILNFTTNANNLKVPISPKPR